MQADKTRGSRRNNDIVSVEKGEAVGDINLVLLLQGERRCSRTAALKLMCTMVEERTNRFIALERGLPALAESLNEGGWVGRLAHIGEIAPIWVA